MSGPHPADSPLEWLTHNMIAPVVATLVAWFWYDKRLRDARLVDLEKRMLEAERRAETHEGDGRVLSAKLDGISAIVDTRMEHIQKSLDRLEDRQKVT